MISQPRKKRQTTTRRKLSRAVAALALGALAFAGAAQARSDWTLDPGRTRISFVVDAVGYPRTTGAFHDFKGEIAVDFEHPERSRVRFRVESGSIDVGSIDFGDYLKSDVFLNVLRFPEIEFVSQTVQKIDESHVRVGGDLILMGVSKPFEVEVEVVRGEHRLGFVAHGAIDRLAYGLNSGFPVIARTIDLTVASEARAP